MRSCTTEGSMGVTACVRVLPRRALWELQRAYVYYHGRQYGSHSVRSCITTEGNMGVTACVRARPLQARHRNKQSLVSAGVYGSHSVRTCITTEGNMGVTACVRVSPLGAITGVTACVRVSPLHGRYRDTPS